MVSRTRRTQASSTRFGETSGSPFATRVCNTHMLMRKLLSSTTPGCLPSGFDDSLYPDASGPSLELVFDKAGCFYQSVGASTELTREGSQYASWNEPPWSVFAQPFLLCPAVRCQELVRSEISGSV